MKVLLTILSFLFCVQSMSQVFMRDSVTLVFADSLNCYDSSVVIYKAGGIVFGKAITEKDLRQLDSLAKEFDKWLAEQKKPKKKWYTFDAQDAGIVACGGFGGYLRGVNQAILFRDYGKGKEFWDIDLSYKRKYADYDNGDMSEAFFGSKTIFVGFTDGFHGTQLGQTMCYIGGALCIALSDIMKYDRPLLALGKKLLLFGIANGVMFRAVYK